MPGTASSIARVTAGGEEEPHVAAHRPEERQVAHDLAVDALLELVDAVVHAANLEREGVVAGLGNIYVDEALFLARVHPSTPSALVDYDGVRRIAEAVVTVLAEAIEDGGTTLADYRDARGERGSHQFRLAVFRRHGKPCVRCGTTIERSVVAGRGTHACPTCQPVK